MMHAYARLPHRPPSTRQSWRMAFRSRCLVCGSLLYSLVRDGGYVHVAYGTLVDAPSVRPTEHIFVGSKAPWFEITDDLPQNEEY